MQPESNDVNRSSRPHSGAATLKDLNAYIAELADQRDENGQRLVVRNGYHRPRKVTTAAGAVEVKAPRVNDKRIDPDTGERMRFSSAILPSSPWPQCGWVVQSGTGSMSTQL